MTQAAYANITTVDPRFWGQPVLQDAFTGKKYCPGFDGETYSKNLWDTVAIGGFLTPGICEVDCKKGRDVDKKKSPGGDGARLTIHGYEPAIITIAITIWTPDQLDELYALWNRINPQAGKGRQVKDAKTGKLKSEGEIFDVSHPTFEIQGVKSVVIVNADGLDKGQIKRSRLFTIHAIEYLPPSAPSAKRTNTPEDPLTTVYDPKKPPANYVSDFLFAKPGSSKKNTKPK